MWIGFICPIDEYRMYGYITNTNVKMIVSVEDDFLPEQEERQKKRDTEIRKIFVSFSEPRILHTHNAQCTMHNTHDQCP